MPVVVVSVSLGLASVVTESPKWYVRHKTQFGTETRRRRWWETRLSNALYLDLRVKLEGPLQARAPLGYYIYVERRFILFRLLFVS